MHIVYPKQVFVFFEQAHSNACTSLVKHNTCSCGGEMKHWHSHKIIVGSYPTSSWQCTI